MRPRKDPGIRQEVFIRAASELFMEKGYEAVSVRDVLDAVADKSASPSVFYYYFSSKDALYRACVNETAGEYLALLREAFPTEGRTITEWMLSLVSLMEGYLLNERSLLLTGSSTPNRLFVEDTREQVTRQIIPLWEQSLVRVFGAAPADARLTAQFLCGGISEMLFTLLQHGPRDPADVRRVTLAMVRLCANAVGLGEAEKKQLLDAMTCASESKAIQTKEEVETHEPI